MQQRMSKRLLNANYMAWKNPRTVDWKNQWTNESMNKWVAESMKQWTTNESMNHWTNEPMNQWISDQRMNWRKCGWIGGWVDGWMDEWATFLCWATSFSLSYFFSEQPLIWATSALSCLPASSSVASATQVFSSRSWRHPLSNLQLQSLITQE